MDSIVFFPSVPLSVLNFSVFLQSSHEQWPQCWEGSTNINKSYLCPAGKANANAKEWLLPQFMCQTLFGPKGKALIFLRNRQER